MKPSMKKLGMLLMMLCVALATSAQPHFAIHEGHWCCAHDDAPNVTILNVEEDHLQDAINHLQHHLNNVNHQHPILRISNYKPHNYSGNPTVTLNADDIAALELLNNFSNFETIDLQDVKYVDGNGKPIAFTFSNSHVKNLILPDDWTKEEVKNCAETERMSNLGSALSQGTADDGNIYIAAYSAKENTMTECVSHIFIDEIPNKKVVLNPEQSCYDKDTKDMSKVKHLYVSGNVVARDLACTSETLTSEGHLKYDREADEFSKQTEAGIGGTMLPTGTQQVCAWDCKNLITVDLSDAIIEDENCQDLCVLRRTGIFDKDTRFFLLPTYSGFHTVPADLFKNNMGSLRQMFIPSNIYYIKTRAFTMQSLIHIWTDGDSETTVYDNGWYYNGELHYGWIPNDVDPSEITWGTYTLPPNLQLIESHAFTQDNASIKDIYSLNVHAPECHVDAFAPNVYNANNGVAEGQTHYGIVTRDSYLSPNGSWVTMLHYPRECVTPDIQRYTDVTREYSVATAERDGKGATLYFPNQTEMARALSQGTTGYLWNAWSAERNPYTNSITPSNNIGIWSEESQQTNNQLYEDNTNTTPVKTDRSFYDVTAGNRLDQPAALQPYYNTVWEGVQLYPQAESTGTGDIRTVVKRDAEGNIIYDKTESGTYIKKGTYTADNEGRYVREYDVTEDANGQYVKNLVFTEAAEGEYYRPYVNSGKWSEQSDLEQNGSYYTYGQKYIEDENGEYCYVENATYWNGTANVHYFPISLWESWNNTADKPYYSLKNVYTLWDGSHSPNQALYVLSDNYEKWTASAGDVTRYDGNWDGTYIPNASANYPVDTRYNVNSYSYVEATDADADKQHYKIVESYVTQEASITAPDEKRMDNYLYAQATEEVEIQNPSCSHDYRGWHQFVLSAYATNSNEKFVPYRSYITDNDWWTICLPFDLTKADMIKLFGKNDSESSKDLPYLSKLTYVVRDVEGKNITLTFSPNLLEHKEVIAEEGQVHGVITGESVNLNDVVLHAGVPYLIRPNMAPEADGKYKRQFDIAFSENDNNAADNALYNRIQNSVKLNGVELKELIYKGIYTVPAYVINNETGAESVGEQVTFTNYDTSSFTYTNSDEFRHNKQTMSASISSDFCYSFVGTFYISRMPQYSYFLGWDSEKQRAAFWYCKASETGKFNWNNETGIICPNFITAQQSLEQRTEKDFKDAEGLSTPAQWKINLKVGDDFNNASVKNYITNSQYGFNAPLWSDEATIIIHIDDDSIEQPTYIKGVYNMNGQYMGESMEGLSKGIYIQNGKKIYVK